MALAQKAARDGHLDAAAFEDLRIRFNAVHDWAVQHLGEAGHLGHLGDGQAGVLQQPGGAAGGQQVDAQGHQRGGEVGDAGLVGYGDQCIHAVYAGDLI